MTDRIGPYVVSWKPGCLKAEKVLNSTIRHLDFNVTAILADLMIKENSGKIYRFRLDHNLGYGFAEVYDFTDHSEFDVLYQRTIIGIIWVTGIAQTMILKKC